MAEQRRQGRRIWGRLAMTLLMVAGLWATGFAWFTSALPKGPSDTTSHTDAIVVLTGGAGRLDQGLELLAQGLAEKLFVSGVYRGVDVDQLLRLSQEAPEDLSCCIVIGYEADDTVGNAVETARWMAREGYGTLRLVTATYHMPRSLIAFRRHLPGVTLIAHPVVPEDFHQDDWWQSRSSTFLLMREYNKFLFAWAQAFVEKMVEGSA